DFYGKRHVHIAYHENYGQDSLDIVYRKTASVLAGEKHEDIPCEVIELVDDLVNDVDKVLGGKNWHSSHEFVNSKTNLSLECIESKDVHCEGSSADEDFIFCEHDDLMEDFVAGCYDFVKKLKEINRLYKKIGIKMDLNFLCEKDISIDVGILAMMKQHKGVNYSDGILKDKVDKQDKEVEACLQTICNLQDKDKSFSKGLNLMLVLLPELAKVF
uniref:Uncharacterized protein n=1 Tax=Romanomermis culicivorax TaxID=13658 RepID=A0A915JSH2_ROMCU